MIHHSVVFRLKHEEGSTEESLFLSEARKLAVIKTVKNFKVLEQVSLKNNFTFGLSMDFSSEEDYSYYNNHPSHIDFVQRCWVVEVEDFMEIDYKALTDD